MAVFMIAVYFLPGFASVIALGIYVALVVLLLNGFDITLTLSGIAGIILSIGMAVDANVSYLPVSVRNWQQARLLRVYADRL